MNRVTLSHHAPRLLLLEDEVDLAEQVVHFLQKRHCQIRLTHSVAETLSALQQQAFDLVILDRLVTDGDSLLRLADIKALYSGPILMMTALGQTSERISGYEAGVDVYFAKPVDLDELYAVILNRMMAQPTPNSPLNNWILSAKTLTCPNGAKLHLSAREEQVLTVLKQHADEIISKARLLEALTINDDDYDYRRMDSMIYRIRKKVARVYEGSFPIETLHSLGYRWSSSLADGEALINQALTEKP